MGCTIDRRLNAFARSTAPPTSASNDGDGQRLPAAQSGCTGRDVKLLIEIVLMVLALLLLYLYFSDTGESAFLSYHSETY